MIFTRWQGKLLLRVTFYNHDGASWSNFVLSFFPYRTVPLRDRYLLGESRNSQGFGSTNILLWKLWALFFKTVNRIGSSLLSRRLLSLVLLKEASCALEVRLLGKLWLVVVVIVFLREVLWLIALMIDWVIHRCQHRADIREVGLPAALDIPKLHLLALKRCAIITSPISIMFLDIVVGESGRIRHLL